MKNQEWFASWFDTTYYHTLYQHRDFEEAEFFISNLLASLKPKKNSTILDLACGRGRHAYYIASKGFNVTGVDLSAQSISWAKKTYPLDSLSFEEHDMRKVFKENNFDFVFNFFTSFGYFSSNEDNQLVINAMKDNLKKDGIIVIDFLNAIKSMDKLVTSEIKTVDEIDFNINKEIIDGFFVKRIAFEDKGKSYSFEERVQALEFSDFKAYFDKAGLELFKVYGNYALEEFNPEKSDRLIMILRKK